MKRNVFKAALLMCLPAWAGAAAPFLSVGSVSGAPGASVTLAVTFTAGSPDVSGLQFTVGVPSGWSLTNAAAGASATSAQKSVSFSASNGNVIVFGINQNAIPSGDVVDLQFTISGSAAAGAVPITLSDIVLSDINGNNVTPGTTTNGTVTVQGGAAPPPPPPPTPPPPTTPPPTSGLAILSFTANPTDLPQGGLVTLTWTVSGATFLALDNGIGTVTGMNTITVNATQNMTYTLLAGDNSTAVTKSVAVRVGPQTNAPVSADLLGEGIRVYPNPWRSDRNGSVNVNFDQLTPNTDLKIFTVSGHHVTTLRSDGNGTASWNPRGFASGLYLYVGRDVHGAKSRGKLALIH